MRTRNLNIGKIGSLIETLISYLDFFQLVFLMTAIVPK